MWTLRTALASLVLSACIAGTSASDGPPTNGPPSAPDTADAGSSSPPSGVADSGGPGDASGGKAEGGGPEASTPSAPIGADIPGVDAYVNGQMALSHTPGLATAIVKGATVKWARGYGFKNDAKEPVTPDTLFTLASVSKTVTGAALMQLVEAGAFALDDDVSATLGFSLRNPGFPKQAITFRHLLTHTSSIANPQGNNLDVTNDSPISLHDFVHGSLEPGGTWYDASKTFSTSSPGTAYSYSNLGIATVGFLVQAHAGTSFEAYTKSHIFDLLHMTSTGWRFADADASRLATPYAFDATSGAYAALGNDGFPDWPAGTLHTSVLEYASFFNAFINDGKLGGVQILQPKTVTEMKRVQLPSVDPNQALVFYYYQTASGTRVLGHNGSDPGVSTIVGFDPTTGAGAIVFSNGDVYDRGDVTAEQAFEAILGRLVDEAKNL